MDERLCSRHRVLVTMSRGDDSPRRFGDPLEFERLGGMVRRAPSPTSVGTNGDEAWAQPGLAGVAGAALAPNSCGAEG